MSVIDPNLVLKLIDAELRHIGPDILTHVVNTAADEFVRATGRSFAPDPASEDDDPVAKTFVVSKGQNEIRVPDLRIASSCTFDGVGMTAGDDYRLEPDPSFGKPATHVRLGWTAVEHMDNDAPLALTGWWGFAVVPPSVIGAIADLAIYKLKRRNNNWADQVVTPEGVSFTYYRSMPTSTQDVIREFRVPRIALV